MEQRHSPADPKQAIVRIYSEAGTFRGTGCLEIGGIIVTCAHVVRDALALGEITTNTPTGKVGVDFPFLDDDQKQDRALPEKLPFHAEIVPAGWGPARGIKLINDIAILRLLTPPPFGHGYGFPPIDRPDRDLPIFVHGFRDGAASPGEHVKGNLDAHSQAADGIWIFDTGGSAYVVNPGFSGAPVFPDNTGWHVGHAAGMLIARPYMCEALREDKRVAYIIPASRVQSQIEAVFKAEAAADATPAELATARAYVPAMRASLEHLGRSVNSAGPFIDGVARELDRFEVVTTERLGDANIAWLAGMVRSMERHAGKAAKCGYAEHLTLFCMHDFCAKLGALGTKLRKEHPELIEGDAVPSDPLEENLPHRCELEALRQAIEERLVAIANDNLPLTQEARHQARNVLWKLDAELDHDPLHLSIFFQVRRELEALDRSVFAELISASQVLLGRYADQLPDLAVFRDFREGPEMVVIPAGKFMMGSPEGEKRFDHEGPQHEVTIAKRFAIGRYPVTFDEWDFAVGHGGCHGHSPKDQEWGPGRRPVIDVSWEQAHTYVAWLRQKTGNNYRLPSEAGWEFCCRAGMQTRFSFGDDEDVLGEYAWYSENSDRKTQPVGEKKPNLWGLYDMHGNVHEWVEDVWHDNYTGAPIDGSPWSDGGSQVAHVVRGGSWFYNYPGFLRSAFRLRYDGPINYIGIRVARTLSPLAP